MRLPPQPDAEIPSAIMTGASAPGGVRPALPGGSTAPHAPQSPRGAVASRLLAFAKSSGQPLREILKAEIAKSAGLHASSRKHAVGKLGLKLSYSPVNADTYVLAFDGALAGMAVGRVSTSLDTDTYVNQTIAATVWAQEFDTLSANAAPLDAVAAQLIFGESYAVWSGRSASSLTSAQCLPIISAILTAIAVAGAELLLAGITPPVYRTAVYVTPVFDASAAPLTASAASVLGGPVSVMSHGGTFVFQFAAQGNFASGQINSTIFYSLLVGGSVLTTTNLDNPTASAFSGSASLLFSTDRIEAGAVITIDVQASTSASSGEASSAQNSAIVTEYVQ